MIVSSHLDLLFCIALLQQSEIERLRGVYYLSLIIIVIISVVQLWY